MKKILALSVLGLAVLGALAWLTNYFSTGVIVITAEDKNSTITLQSSERGSPASKIGLGSLSATVSHGQYTATVKSGSQTSVQIINFKEGHKTFRYSIGLSSLGAVEPVAYRNAKDAVANSSQLLYLDMSGNYLYKIDGQNNVTALNSSQPLQAIRWADPSFGIGQGSDGHLYSIVNGFVRPLNVPFSYSNSSVAFDVSPNGQIYLSSGPDVYRGSQNTNFKKIYTAVGSNLKLAAAANKVAIVDETEDQNNSISVIDTSGKLIRKGAAGEVARLVWSPNGQYLISVGKAYAAIYDSSLHQIATLPADSVVGYIVWLDNSKLFYSSNDKLWSYDMANQRATLQANMPFGHFITGLTISSDKSYVYMTTVDSGSGNNYAIQRIGLGGQRISDYLYKLQNILPLTLSDCSISLVNFASPATILVESFPNSNLTQQAYLQEAQTELKQDGLDVSTLQFKLAQGR